MFQVTKPLHPEAVRVVELPEQIFELPEMIGLAGFVFNTTVWVAEDELVQLFTVQVAENVPADATFIELAVVPLLQITVPLQPLAVRVVL